MDHDNLETYADAADYDCESGGPYVEPGALVRRLALAAGPVLDLGCGTGRTTIPLARAGANMTGLDLSANLLAHARQKAGDLPITWVAADGRDFQLGRRFGFIFTRGGVLPHLLTRPDQAAFLARAREHLAPAGQFLIDAYYKPPAALVDEPEETDWYTYEDPAGRPVRLTGTDQYDHYAQTWTQIAYHYRQVDGQEVRFGPSRLVQRYFMPQEFESLLECNGLTIVERYADWDGTPFAGELGLCLYLCAASS